MSSRPAMGVAMIALDSYWYTTRKHTFPSNDMNRKFPVRSEYTTPEILSANAAKQKNICCGVIVIVDDDIGKSICVLEKTIEGREYSNWSIMVDVLDVQDW